MFCINSLISSSEGSIGDAVGDVPDNNPYTDSGKMFRLYNASFKRLPHPDGLQYWIGNFSAGKDDERAVASSFLASAEFQQRYGENVSNESYVETLYENVLIETLTLVV